MAANEDKLNVGDCRPAWLPTAKSAHLGPNCNCNVVFTCAREGWGFRLVKLAKLLSPKLGVTQPTALTELLKSRCVRVSLSSASPLQRRTHSSVASSLRSTPSTPCWVRIALDTCTLLPAARCPSPSSFSPTASLFPTHRWSP
uniref:Uncharacterized protein n=1 Tax=Oryza punctata TaxID=4537 RepID=A0A0E0KWP9_ORYPU